MPILAFALPACTWIPNDAVPGDTACGANTSEPSLDETVAVFEADFTTLDVARSDTFDLGVASESGCTDVLSGSLALNGADGWGSNDSDVYRFTLAEPSRVRLTASWSADADLDFGIWTLLSGAVVDAFDHEGHSCRGNTEPESCTLAAALPADTELYLLALGYQGETVDVGYTIELEWLGE